MHEKYSFCFSWQIRIVGVWFTQIQIQRLIMSDQKNTTETPNIDDYLLNINIEDSTPSNTMGDGLDMDFLNQLGSESATPQNSTSVDEFDLDSLGGLDDPITQNPEPSHPFQDANTVPMGEPAPSSFSTAPQDQDNATVAATAGAVAGAVGTAILANSTAKESKKGKGFFSGRFGKKEKSAPTPADSTDNFTETLLAKKAPKKGLFSRLNKSQDTAKTDTTNTADSTVKTEKTGSKPFGGFGRNKEKDTAKPQKTPRSTRPPRTPKDGQPKAVNPEAKKKQQLLLGALLCLALLGLVAYLFLNNTAPEPTPVATPAPAPQQVEPTPTPAPAPVAEQGNILPNTAPTVNPDEILNAEIPSDPALVKEEIDRLNDTGARLDEQGKIIEEQLTLMEDLTTAKAEQIALLEKQIAELEKQKSSVGTPAPTGEPTPPPAPAPAGQ